MASVAVCQQLPGAEECVAEAFWSWRSATCLAEPWAGRAAVPPRSAQPVKTRAAQRQKRSLAFAEEVPRPLRRRVAVAAPRALDLHSLPTIVVNLDRRPDRMTGCAARLTAHCPGLQFTRFSATDGRETKISTADVATSWHSARNVVYQKLRSARKGWDDADSYKARRMALSAGERGCASSHVRAWRRCLKLARGTDRPLLVLEDDAAPTAEFAQVLSRALTTLPPDAGVLYLGYSQAAEWRREVSPELVEAEYVWTTVAYIVWPAAARLLLGQLPVNEPVDNFMAGLCAEKKLKAYCVRPKIVLQADAWNVNSDVAHSDENYWGPDSDIQHTGAEQQLSMPMRTSCLLGDGDSDSDSEADA